MKRGAYGNVGQRLEGEQPTRSSRLRRGVYLKSTAQMLNWRSRAPYFYPDWGGEEENFLLTRLAAVVGIVIYTRSYAFKNSPRLIFVCVQIVRSVELFSLG
jgi:hypothetical protein